MKAVLVIDLPDDINVDDVGITYIVQQWNGLLVKAQVEHVPLKPLPEPMPEVAMTIQDISYAMGWNECLEMIDEEIYQAFEQGESE